MILHEEAEDGNTMPDLSRPVEAVKLAVDNLVQVGGDKMSKISHHKICVIWVFELLYNKNIVYCLCIVLL